MRPLRLLDMGGRVTAPADAPFDFGARFGAVGDRLRTENEERMDQAPRCLKFGVHFLDVALGGIFPGDLILLGAKTGIGKTSLAVLIAQANALKGKRVHFFALEAEPKEIERRLKYNMVAEAMAERRRIGYDRLNFLDWYMGRFNKLTAAIEVTIDGELAQAYRNLHTYYNDGTITIETLERLILGIQGDTDLVVIDHLHFLDSDDPSENRAMKAITKRIRMLALSIGKPVIVVAHVRKSERRGAPLVPTLDDFHGSSDIPKIATKAIMIAPAYDQSSGESHKWATFIHPAKCRFDGQRTRYVGVVMYNSRMGAYERPFSLGRLSTAGDEFTFLSAKETPTWAHPEAHPEETPE